MMTVCRGNNTPALAEPPTLSAVGECLFNTIYSNLVAIISFDIVT
jgi:hypothetical protein